MKNKDNPLSFGGILDLFGRPKQSVHLEGVQARGRLRRPARSAPLRRRPLGFSEAGRACTMYHE